MVGDTGEGTPLPRSCTGAHPSPAPLLPAEGVLGVSRYDGRADFAGMLILDSGGVPTTAPACPPVPTALCPSPIPIAHSHRPVSITLHPTALPPSDSPTSCSQYHTKSSYWDEACSWGGSCGTPTDGRLFGWDDSPSPPNEFFNCLIYLSHL